MKLSKMTLKACRVNAGLKAEDVAKALGISVWTLRGYETGRTIPRMDMVNKLCELYKVPIEQISLG